MGKKKKKCTIQTYIVDETRVWGEEGKNEYVGIYLLL